MGQDHQIVNLTQRAAFHPSETGEGVKLMEFGSDCGMGMAGLWLLLGREAWCGDRVAILGDYGEPGDLEQAVVGETGYDGTAFGHRDFSEVGSLVRELLTERGLCTFGARGSFGEMWEPAPAEISEVPEAGVEVVVADLDQRQILDPAQFGQSRDLNVSAMTGGHGGVTTALAVMLAASNRGGARGGGDLRSAHGLVGSWAGHRIGVVPVTMTTGWQDISTEVRGVLTEARGVTYRVTPDQVELVLPERLRRFHAAH